MSKDSLKPPPPLRIKKREEELLSYNILESVLKKIEARESIIDQQVLKALEAVEGYPKVAEVAGEGIRKQIERADEMRPIRQKFIATLRGEEDAPENE